MRPPRLGARGTDGVVTAVLHRLAPESRVVGIDHLQGLVDMSKENLKNDSVVGERVEMICGDGRAGGSLRRRRLK